jgi:hypothetical protein
VRCGLTLVRADALKRAAQHNVRRHPLTPSQFMVANVFTALLVAACAQTEVAKDGDTQAPVHASAPGCGYQGDHDISTRLRCLGRALEAMMPPNNRLVSDASASARRASYSAPQSER